MKQRHGAAPVRRLVLGAMAGTSLDGVDAAVIDTDGVTVFGFGPSAFRPYSDAEQATLRAGLGLWDGPQVEAAADLTLRAHAELLGSLLADVPQVSLVGFHGQTLAHDPRGRGTLQAGDGAALARALGRPVVWDFRSADIAMGGEGAPLAPFYHFALARKAGVIGPVAVLNLGGVGNLTWIDPTQPGPETPGALLAFDTGPANAPVNDLMRARRGAGRDDGGALAATGTVAPGVVEDFLTHRHFARMPPKSLDRDAFAGLQAAVADLSDADAAATLTACAAAGVMVAMDHCPAPPGALWVTGGGRHNATLMAMIAAAVSCPVVPIEDAGFDGDMLEAQAFAHLAARVTAGLPTSCPGTTGVGAAIGGGTVSRPEDSPARIA